MVALFSTFALVLSSMASVGTDVAAQMHEAASWPIHVVNGAVTLGSVFLALHFGRSKDKMTMERDRITSEAMGRVADGLIAMRDAMNSRNNDVRTELVRLSAVIGEHFHGRRATDNSTQSQMKGPEHEQPQPTV